MTVPPPGIAWRALTSRFRKICLSRVGLPWTSSGTRQSYLSQLDALVRVRAADELDGLLADPVQRDGPDVVGLGAGVPEQRIHDLPDLEPALPDEEQPVVLVRSRLEVGEQNVDEAEDPEERVVDLVRDAPDELSERAEPTRLEEGFSFGSGWIRAEERRSGCGVLHPHRYRKESAAPEVTAARESSSCGSAGRGSPA